MKAEKEIVQDFSYATLLKKRILHRFFPMNFPKFLRTPFFTEHLWWMLLLSVKNTRRARTTFNVENILTKWIRLQKFNSQGRSVESKKILWPPQFADKENVLLF